MSFGPSKIRTLCLESGVNFIKSEDEDAQEEQRVIYEALRREIREALEKELREDLYEPVSLQVRRELKDEYRADLIRDGTDAYYSAGHE